MTPFEEFKYWLRNGSASERKAAALAGALALVLVGWVLVPADDGASDSVATLDGPAAQTTEPAAAAAPTDTPGAGAPGDPTAPANTVPATGTPSDAPAPAGSPAATATGGQQAASAGAATCPIGATDQGVSDTTVSIAVILLDVAGGNSVLGFPSVEEQRRQNQALIDHFNSKGGIRCRKITAKFFTDNPLDANSERAVCLDVVAMKPFAAIGGLYQPQNATCLPQNKLPSFTQTIRPTSESKRFSPYLFSFYNDSDTALRSYVAGAKEMGFFNGMSKLGVLTAQCYPEYNDQLFAALGRAGVGRDKIETFDYGCPAGNVPPPTTVSQSVLQFQRSGVDRVMTAHPNLAAFSHQAQSQGYKPLYAVSGVDVTMELSNSPGFAPHPENFDGALSITNSQFGALNSKLPTSKPTAECDAALTKGGAQKSTDGIGYAGGTCNQWFQLVLGATNAPNLVRTQIAAGLQKLGTVDQPYPGAPARYDTPGKTWAGPAWRPAKFEAGCRCYKVVRAEFSDAQA